MLGAYAKRQGNLPTPGQYPENFKKQKSFQTILKFKELKLLQTQGIVDFSLDILLRQFLTQNFRK